MGSEENKAIVRRYLEEVIKRGRFEIAEEIITVDYINHTAGGAIGSGRNGFVNSIKAVRTAFPDWTVSIKAVIAEGDTVCDHCSIRATHSGQTVAIPRAATLLPLPSSVDVAVIGAGFTGLSAARVLAKRGAKVSVLEA